MKNLQIISRGKYYAGAYTTKWPKSRKDIGEDAVLALSDKEGIISLIAVADGVGGFYGGEIASRNVLQILKETFWDSEILHDLKDKSNKEIIEKLEKISELFIIRVKKTLNRIWKEEFRKNKKLSKKAFQTNLAVVVVINNKIFYSWLGDSRVICFVNGRLFQLSYDHALGIFKSREEIIKFENELNSKNLQDAIIETIKGKGEDMLLFFGANMEIDVRLKWFHMEEMFKLIYYNDSKEMNGNSSINFNHVFVATDGVFFPNIWYIEQLFLGFVFSYASPKNVSKMCLKFMHEYSTDDMGLALWSNPNLNREKDLGLLISPSIYSKMIDEYPHPELFLYWENLKEKLEKIKSEKEKVLNFFDDCKKTPLKQILMDYKDEQKSFFKTEIQIKNKYKHVFIGKKDPRNVMLGDWTFDKIELEKIIEEEKTETRFKDIFTKLSNQEYNLKIDILGNEIVIKYFLKLNNIKITCQGIPRNIGIWKIAMNPEEINLNSSQIELNPIIQNIKLCFLRQIIILEKSINQLQYSMLSDNKNLLLNELDFFYDEHFIGKTLADIKLGSLYKLIINKTVKKNLLSFNLKMKESDIKQKVLYQNLSEIKPDHDWMNHEVSFEAKENPLLLLFGKFDILENSFEIFKTLIFVA